MSKIHPSYYKWEIENTLINWYFENAKLTDTKMAIMGMVKDKMADIEKRGERLFALLYFSLAKVGLYKMQGETTKEYIDVVNEVIDLWDKSPEFRNRRALAEFL